MDLEQQDILAHMLNEISSQSGQTRFTDNWSQGRSAFGGLSAAFAVTAMRQQVDEDKPIRSLMVSFVAPLPPGEVLSQARIQREGKNVSQVAADVLSDGQLCLQAMAAFGTPRPSLAVPASPLTSLPPRDTGIPFMNRGKGLPAFLSYFDGFWVNGVIPFSNKQEREMHFWVRHKQDVSAYPVERLVTLADIPPPVVLAHFDRPPVPASSLTWSIEFVKNPAEVSGDWFYMEFTLEAAANGYTQQSGRLFDENGELCLLSRQCMVFFQPATQ